MQMLHEMLEQEAQAISRQFIVKMIDRKLRAADIELTEELTASLADRLVSGGTEWSIVPGGLDNPNYLAQS